MQNLTLKTVLRLGGAVQSTQWMVGSGKGAKKAPIPMYCTELELKGSVEEITERYRLNEYARLAISALKHKSPRTRKAVVCTNYRGALETLAL
jgi:hypothetical protein